MVSTRTKSELAALDGLRGLAAFAVVLMHASTLVPHAYLAVDLFFVLSGFVLEHAYGRRLGEGWGVVAFMAKRLRRLYPLYALGLAISVLAVGGGLLIHRAAGWTWPDFAAAAVTGAAMLPVWPIRQGQLYPLDFPAWTLLAELLVNLVFAAVYRRLSNGVLIAVTLAAAAVMTALALGHGDLNGGTDWPTFPLGLARAAFAFPAGVLLRRLAGRRLPPLLGVLALLGAVGLLYAPALAVDPRLYDLAAVLIGFPALIAVAAASDLRGPLRALAVEAGAASYGVYVAAVPVYIVVHAALRARGLATDALPPLEAWGFCLGLFAAAFAIRRLTSRR